MPSAILHPGFRLIYFLLEERSSSYIFCTCEWNRAELAGLYASSVFAQLGYSLPLPFCIMYTLLVIPFTRSGHTPKPALHQRALGLPNPKKHMCLLTRPINPKQAYINEIVTLSDGTICHRYDIGGTPVVAYAAYRRIPELPGDYLTVTYLPDYGWLGDITSKKLPSSIDHLASGSPERIGAVVAYLDNLVQQAQLLIKQAFPRDFQGGTS